MQNYKEGLWGNSLTQIGPKFTPVLIILPHRELPSLPFLSPLPPTPSLRVRGRGEEKGNKLQGDKLADVKFRLGRGEGRSSCAPVGLRFHNGLSYWVPSTVIQGLPLLSLSGSWISFHTVRAWKSLTEFQKESRFSDWKSMGCNALLCALGIPSLEFFPVWHFQDLGMTLGRKKSSYKL